MDNLVLVEDSDGDPWFCAESRVFSGWAKGWLCASELRSRVEGELSLSQGSTPFAGHLRHFPDGPPKAITLPYVFLT